MKIEVNFSLVARDVDVDTSKAREQLTSSDKRERPRLISSFPYTAQTVPILSYKNRIEPFAYAKKTYANTHLTPLYMRIIISESTYQSVKQV